MHKTLIVKGMMCPHNACTAEVELSREVAEDALKAAVKAAGYEYGGMKG